MQAYRHWSGTMLGTDSLFVPVQTATRTRKCGIATPTPPRSPVANVDKLVGRRIQQFRRDSDMTQQMLADRLRIDRSVVSRVERGKQRLYIADAIEFAAALSVEFWDLLR